MNFKPRNCLLVLCLLPIVVSGGDVFSFGGIVWDQKHTPDITSYLGEGKTHGGAIFSDGLPLEVTRTVNFPDKDEGFEPQLSLGFISDGSSAGPRALNLPMNNDGSIVRHGVSLGWSGNRIVPNLSGPEFVIYESGEGVSGEKDSRGPELFMLRVRNAATKDWTTWYHKGTKLFHPYSKISAAGAYATAFDLDELGLSLGDSVDRLEIANMVRSDSITGPSIPYAGKVLFSDQQKMGVRPRPMTPFIASYEHNLLYGPDLLYVACLQKTIISPFALSETHSSVSAPQKKIAADEARAEEVVVLLATEGQVSVFFNKNNQFLPEGEIFLNMSIGSGYSIVTGSKSAATLLLPDGAVLVLQPGSLVSLDHVVRKDTPSPPGSTPATKFTIHLIRGAFLLANQNAQDGDASFELDAGRAGIRGSGGVIFFQMGEPLLGDPDESAGRARKLFFELKTGMLILPVEDPLVFVTPVLNKTPAFAPPDVNPSDLPSDFAPIHLAFQNLAFLSNPIIPDSGDFDIGAGTLGFFDPDKFLDLLIPSNETSGEGVWGGGSSTLLADMVAEDGTLALDPEALDNIANDPYMVQLFNTAGDAKIRLTLDGSGNPVFLLEDGTQIQGVDAPEVVKQLLADNPTFGDLLDLSAEGIEVNLDQQGRLTFQLEDGGRNIPGINGNIQLTLDEDGNMVFLPGDGVSLPDVLPPGIIGDTSDDQMVIKRPEGNEGRLRRAHAQRVSQIQASKAKKIVSTTNQQRSSQASKAAQQRAARDAQRRAQLAAQKRK